MANDHLERIERLETGFEMIQFQLQAQQHVLAWLLHQQPQIEVNRFLAGWKQECKGVPALEHDEELIDALAEDLQQLRADCA